MSKRILTLVVLLGLIGAPVVAEDSLPNDVKGFSGQVRGVVISKGEKNTFMFKVARVIKVWKNNKAKNPKSLAGHTVRVGPRWQKNEKGRWHPAELHVKFIRKIEKGQEITLEIVNHELSHFNILELSHDQREIAGGKETSERNKDAEIRELKKVVDVLKKENRDLRNRLKEITRTGE